MKKFDAFVHELFHDFGSKRFLFVNNFLAVLTLISILGIALETVEALEPYALFFTVVEYSTVFFFTIEYVGRIFADRKRPLTYILSFYGLVDVISILPTFLGAGNLTFLKSVRILRILRLLRIIRLAKITRLAKQRSKELEDYAYLYRLNIQIYFFALFSTIVVFGSLMYVVEGGTNETFKNIPLSMIWVAKVTLGGIAQSIPTTTAGEIISILTRFVGLGLFGLLISIIGSSLTRVLFGTTKISAGKKY